MVSESRSNTASSENRLTKTIGITAGIVAIFAITAVAIWWVFTPRWTALLSGELGSESEQEAISYLMQWQIPFQQDEATGEVLVREDVLQMVRTKLETVGIPSETMPGLDVFSESDYGMSEFSQRINYQRGLEGEIAKTVRSFADVKWARVHLTLPKESLFKDRQSPAKASIVVQSKPEQTLLPDQVSGIQSLAAAAVENLEPDHVIVLNELGQQLSSSDDALGAKSRVSNGTVEQEYAEKAKKLVGLIVQGAEIQVAVHAKINYDRIKSVKEQVLPAEDNTSAGFMVQRREQITNETSAKESAKPETKNQSIEEKFIFSKERSEIEYASGNIESLGIGIVVLSEIDEKTKDDIERVVASGLGLDEQRGDKITVVAVVPRTNEKASELEMVKNTISPGLTRLTSSSSSEFYLQQPLIWLLVSVFVMIFLVVTVVLMRRSSANSPRSLTENERAQVLNEVRSWLNSDYANVQKSRD